MSTAAPRSIRVLLLVDCYLPSTKSSAQLIHDLAAELRDQGHRPIVAVPDPALDRVRRVSDEEGITVVRVRTGRIKTTFRPQRAINEARLSGNMWRAARRWFEQEPCDLIVFYSPTIFFGALVERLKRLWGCPAYLILRDIFPQWAVDAGLLRKGGIPYRFFRRKELLQYDVANVIGVQSPANLEYFREHGLAAERRLEVLWHWSPRSHGPLPRTDYRRQLGLEDKIVFFYGGNIGVAQDMDNVLRLAVSLRDEPHVHFLLMGDGSEVARLQAVASREGLRNVSLHPPLAQKEYLAALSEFDVGLITLDRGLKTQNFPGKMLGYMYFGIPTLASINPGNDLGQVIEEHEAGLVSINGEDRRLREHALRLAREPDLRRRLGENGLGLLQRSYTTTRAAEQILRTLG